MIGGIIVLALFLIALVAMVMVSQQYAAYQNTVNVMSQKDIERFSELLMVVYPGLAGNYVVNGCSSTCNLYNMTLSNLGGVGVQIARIYINSTGSGCTVNVGLCVLNPAKTPTAYTFNVHDGYLNPGESNHTVRLWLPKTIVLLNQTLVPSNSVSIVTSRGRIFTFQYPFPPAGPATPGTGKTPNIQTGAMKIAYNASSADSSKEGGGNIGSGYCHTEPTEAVSAGGTGPLTFVRPWITQPILDSVCLPNGSCSNFYIYANTTNSLSVPITINQGNLIVQVASSASDNKVYFIGGPLVGVVYPVSPSGLNNAGVFKTSATISPGARFILVFQIIYTNASIGSASPSGLVFSGTATVNNGASSPPSSSFRELAIYLDGLYVRSSC